MITQAQYFGAKPHTAEHVAAATELLFQVNALLTEFQLVTDREPDIDPDTGTEISGAKGGAGDGGFRLPTATTGRKLSTHKRGHGVDHYDPDNGLDEWLDTFEYGDGKNSKLEQYGLYREHPSSTPTWCHLQDVPPGSGKQTYNP